MSVEAWVRGIISESWEVPPKQGVYLQTLSSNITVYCFYNSKLQK